VRTISQPRHGLHLDSPLSVSIHQPLRVDPLHRGFAVSPLWPCYPEPAGPGWQSRPNEPKPRRSVFSEYSMRASSPAQSGPADPGTNGPLCWESGRLRWGSR
jgi:hypothetical protein